MLIEFSIFPIREPRANGYLCSRQYHAGFHCSPFFLFTFTRLYLPKRIYQHAMETLSSSSLEVSHYMVNHDYKDLTCLIMEEFANKWMILLDMTDVRLKTACLTDKITSITLALNLRFTADQQAVQKRTNPTIDRNTHITNHG